VTSVSCLVYSTLALKWLLRLCEKLKLFSHQLTKIWCAYKNTLGNGSLLTNIFTVIDFPLSKIGKKNSLKECVFVNSALKIQCHVVKIHSYTLLFRRFCPLGLSLSAFKDLLEFHG